jgi:hypothetical protein
VVKATCEKALGLLEQALVLMDSKHIDLPAIRVAMAIEELQEEMAFAVGGVFAGDAGRSRLAS